MSKRKVLATAVFKNADTVEVLNATFRGAPALKLSGGCYCPNVRYAMNLDRLQKRIERDARFIRWA